MEYLINLPKETLYIFVGCVMGAICALHIIGAFCSGISAKILQFVNIFLHISLFFILLLAECNISVAVAFYMISLYLFVSVRETLWRKKTRTARKEKQNDL